MQCDACKKEIQWLEVVGKEFICHKCIQKNKLMGLILRTHMNTFKYLLAKLKIKNYDQLMAITRKQAEEATDLKKYGIVLKTTNVVELD